MFYYLLEGNSRHELRQQLKKLCQYQWQFSSCYQLGSRHFVLIGGVASLNADDCMRTPLELSAMQLNPLNPHDYLCWWGFSELLQNIDWLQLEAQATIGQYALYFQCGDAQVIRSFLPLSETMLVINYTPDSFSDGGKYNTIDQVLERIETAVASGVTVVDLGAESTRPGAVILNAEEEIDRLQTLIAEISHLTIRKNFRLSLDSYKRETIAKFLTEIDIVNDVSGKLDNELLSRIANHGKTYAFMHSLTIPANPQVTIDLAINPGMEIRQWSQNKLDQLINLGFKPQQLIADPGIGFNKTMEQSWYLLRHVEEYFVKGIEVLIGHSRKRFLNKITTKSYSLRDPESAIVAVFLAYQGVDYIRLHDYQDYFSNLSILNQLKTMKYDAPS